METVVDFPSELELGRLGEAGGGEPTWQRPLGRTVADWLAEEIVFGRIKPGTRLTTAAICAQLGVSQTPVREAFRVLHGEGLLRLESRRGAWVAEIEPHEVEDIYECRAYLQGLGVRQCAQRATPEELRALEEASGRMRAAVDANDLNRYFRDNVELHRLITTGARNRTLGELNERLGRRTLQLRYLSMSLPGRLEDSCSAHEAIVRLIVARKGVRAEKAMRDLIRRSGAVLRKGYASR